MMAENKTSKEGGEDELEEGEIRVNPSRVDPASLQRIIVST